MNIMTMMAVTFLFNVKNEARIVTNLVTKVENIDYKIIK